MCLDVKIDNNNYMLKWIENEMKRRLTGVAGDWIHYKLPFSLYLAWFVFAWHFLPVVLIITHLIDQSINSPGPTQYYTLVCQHLCTKAFGINCSVNCGNVHHSVFIFLLKAHYTIMNSITKWYVFVLVRNERTNQVRQMQFPQVGGGGQRMAGLLNSVH